MKRIKITVTATDIRLGYKYAHVSDKCPIALALKRKFPKRETSSGYSYAHIDGVTHWYPKVAKDFQEDMFNDEKVKPFSFNILARRPAHTRTVVV